jgi:hypothetical protein
MGPTDQGPFSAYLAARRGGPSFVLDVKSKSPRWA